MFFVLNFKGRSSVGLVLVKDDSYALTIFFQSRKLKVKMPKYSCQIAIALFLILSTRALAQGIAVSLPIKDASPSDDVFGKIVSFKDGDYVLSTIPYDTNIVGVIVESPTLALAPATAVPGEYLVLSQGEAKVRVSAQGDAGAIKVGDFITPSETPGIGKKADMSGNILGTALEPLAQGEGTILVNVQIRAAFASGDVRGNLLQTVRSGWAAPFLTPVASLRYVLAALVTAGAFVIGFGTFGKTSGSGIEAIGRNPLAKQAIQVSIIINFAMTGLIMLLGLGLAYLILVL
ncbi:MAG: hypothetical protein UX69_C0010G0009 [candidate division WWE3 bacterium GW2011_GWA2_46_9]|uniref:Uncharacterized protein n=1 Tax=candidate division WWE3 bacterium GW2011_GWA2_46_9 TaxID=1619111 RepID=A0A0G1QV47_UNCKA|nr:MAG: hypothetical protein UX69_C0010G0009 [candidate division WWE3 bacterium GW2011_GWA2_46_9]